MGCYHESEPSIDEQFGLDVVSVHALAPNEDIDRTLRLFTEEDIAENKVQGVQLKIVIADRHQQILLLYDELRPKLLQYLHKRMYLKRDVAEEVIQETFLRLTTELMEPSYIENVQGWIVRVAHNLAADVITRRLKDAARITDISAAEFEAFIDPAPGPDEVLRLKEQSKRLEAALLTLTPHQRQCFNLRVQGFRYKDIGQALGMSEQRAAIVVKQVAVRVAALCQQEEPK
ncbi:MAG: polymerase, sigma-24 subunit, subfamily [Acidobacteriaceae bacterium]|nr:polymerase, sigma-24 subunit, subfamily [Acidobacteriaceae bacterium]